MSVRSLHERRAPQDTRPARRSLPVWWVLIGVILGAVEGPAAAKAAELFGPLRPTAATNEVGITVTPVVLDPVSAVSQVEPTTILYLYFDTLTHQLTVVDADIFGSDVSFQFPSLRLDATDLRVRLATDIPNAPIPTVEVDPDTGSFSLLNVPVRFTGFVSLNGSAPIPALGETTIVLSGTFAYDAGSGWMALTDVSGDYGPLPLQITQSFSVQISGATVFNMSAGPLESIFADGFEGGHTSEWSATVPSPGP